MHFVSFIIHVMPGTGPICAGDIVANYELDCRFDGAIAPGIWKPPMCTEPAIGTYPSECLPHPSSICQDQETKHVTCICPYTYGENIRRCEFRVDTESKGAFKAVSMK